MSTLKAYECPECGDHEWPIYIEEADPSVGFRAHITLDCEPEPCPVCEHPAPTDEQLWRWLSNRERDAAEDAAADAYDRKYDR